MVTTRGSTSTPDANLTYPFPLPRPFWPPLALAFALALAAACFNCHLLRDLNFVIAFSRTAFGLPPVGAPPCWPLGCWAPEALAASTSQPMGVRGLGRNGWSSAGSAIVALLTGGVEPLRVFLFGEGLTRSGVRIAAASAASALASLPGEGPLLTLTGRPGLALGLLPFEPDLARDWLLLRDFDFAAGRCGGGGVGPLPVPSGS